MNQFFQALQNHWAVILLYIVSAVISVVTAVVMFVRWAYPKFQWAYQKLPTRREVAREEAGRKPITLRARHNWHPNELTGRRVHATGIIVHRNYGKTDTPSLELHAFPFSIHYRIACQFAGDNALALRNLDTLKLVSVVGDAPEENAMSQDGTLRLVNCRVLQPRFFDWVRHAWIKFPPVDAFRQWWYLA